MTPEIDWRARLQSWEQETSQPNRPSAAAIVNGGALIRSIKAFAKETKVVGMVGNATGDLAIFLEAQDGTVKEILVDHRGLISPCREAPIRAPHARFCFSP